MSKALRKYAGYAAFAAAALVVLVWMKMPSDALRSLVLSALSKNKADLLVRLETAELALPFGLTLTGLSVQPRDGRGPGLEAGTVTARAAVLPLMTGRLAFRVQATAMGGRVDGDISFRDRFSASGPVRADLRFGGIDAADCPGLAGLLGRSVRGRVDGQLRFEGLPERWSDGSGHLELAMVNGLITFKAPLFGLQEMAFTKMEGSLELGNGRLRVNRLEIAGDVLQGDFQGSVQLGGDLSQSRLALRGDVNLPAAGPERFAVEVGGTVTNPVVTPL